MRVAVYHSNSDLRIEERPRPEPGPDELLMRIEASGICGSDLMEWYRVPRAPLVLGHEVAGTVEAAGEGLDAFPPGTRIVATHHVPCGECRYCETDRHSHCATLHSTQFDPGGFAEFVRLSPIHVRHGVFALPDGVGFDAGSFVEPLACTIRGQRVAGLREGQSVAVLGSGVSGILHLQLARAAGARLVAVTDLSDFRLALARRLGAAAAARADGDPVAELIEANGGERFEQVVVCAAARSAIDQAFKLVDEGGTILFFAPLPPDQTYELPLNELWKSGVALVHSYAGPPDDMRAAIALIDGGRIDLESMITHRLALEQIQEGFRLMSGGAESLKIIVHPHGQPAASRR